MSSLCTLFELVLERDVGTSLVYFHPQSINHWWGIRLPIKHRPFPSSSGKVTKQWKIFHWLRFGPKHLGMCSVCSHSKHQMSNEKDHFLTGQISKGVPLGCVRVYGLIWFTPCKYEYKLFFFFLWGVMLLRCQLTFKPFATRAVQRKYTKRTEN